MFWVRKPNENQITVNSESPALFAFAAGKTAEMKIDTTNPRIPLDRLKRPVKPTASQVETAAKDEIKKTDAAEFCDAFERAVIEDGARKFKKWLDELDIK